MESTSVPNGRLISISQFDPIIEVDNDSRFQYPGAGSILRRDDSAFDIGLVALCMVMRWALFRHLHQKEDRSELYIDWDNKSFRYRHVV